MKITVEKANHDNSQKTAMFLEDLKQERCIFKLLNSLFVVVHLSMKLDSIMKQLSS